MCGITNNKCTVWACTCPAFDLVCKQFFRQYVFRWSQVSTVTWIYVFCVSVFGCFSVVGEFQCSNSHVASTCLSKNSPWCGCGHGATLAHEYATHIKSLLIGS